LTLHWDTILAIGIIPKVVYQDFSENSKKSAKSAEKLPTFAFFLKNRPRGFFLY
jgi:hypothetical protein